MKRMLWLGLGMVLGALALGAVWASTDGDLTLRMFGVQHDDGRVEVGLQQLGEDGEWHDLEAPQYRYIPVEPEVGQRLYSSEVVVPVETRTEAVAREYGDYLHTSGVDSAIGWTDYFDRTIEEGNKIPPILCIVDPEDGGIGALCAGLAEQYTGHVEIFAPATLAGLQAEIEAMIGPEGGVETDDGREAFGGWFATSLETALAAIDAEDAAEVNLPGSYWIELVDQHIADPDSLFCVISHGGPEPQGYADLFWGLAGEAAYALAGGLDLELRTGAYLDIDQQVEAARECIAEGAAAVAITLSDPEKMQPVVDEANEAGIPILSFNSGSEVASDVGSTLHFGLDDRRAGELAGEAFNDNEITGNVLCIIHEPKNIGLEARCEGLESTYEGEVEVWQPTSQWDLPFDLMDRVEEGGVDAVLSLSINSAVDVTWIFGRNDIDIPTAGFGFGVGTASRIVDGELLFTIIDHPEIQAYTATALAHMLDRFRIDPALYFQGAAIEIEPIVMGPEEAQAMLDSLKE